MEISDNKLKQRALDLAEDARQKDWDHPSFVAELFKGRFQWDLIDPYPVQSSEDKAIGDVFLKKLEKCLKEHVDPEKVDREQKVPESAIKALAEIGCFGMKIDKEYGGLGFSVINYNRAIACVGKHCGSTAVWLSAHQSIGVPQPLKMFGTEEQRKTYLPRVAKGAITAFALTEPDVGSDPANMKTKAVLTEDGNHYIINGEKMWITNGPDAELMIVMAQTPPKIVNGKERKQITAFLIETNMQGFEVTHTCQFMGIRGISNGVLRFKDLKVPKENIIGEVGRGLKIALVTLNTGRLTIPAAVTGACKVSLGYAREWSTQRIQWGLPIGKHQAVTQKLANNAADIFAMESVTWLASAMAENGKFDFRLEAAMAKYFCTEIAWKVMDDILQIRGGRGYETAESLRNRGEAAYPIERILREVRVNRIIEGTSEIMQLFIAREAMDMHFGYIMPLLNAKNSKEKRNALLKMMGFYTKWYPKQWVGGAVEGAKWLSSENNKHLAYIGKTSKKLARALFHAMVKYQKELEKEQIVLGHFVDIGTLLFAMAAVLSNTNRMSDDLEKSSSVQELADLACRRFIVQIEDHFKSIKKNHNGLINSVGKRLFEGNYKWLERN
ncbi:Acyl-CoA dehydrogenase [hydrothermal vent metagenome]|uniref:Acyl-CoA dehydrogenase n=1 Tax=hydrothermal vent metagenome TaxID=652676 RepID=A0A3B1DJU1_9ZZZZ